MCGEKCFFRPALFAMLGSPPHVRGKELVPETLKLLKGITPACAGKRRLSVRRGVWLEDHPRMCGEKTKESFYRSTSLGSPPHVRGKVSIEATSAPSSRITPACAGKRKSKSRGQNFARITPACAGKRAVQSTPTKACLDHPRMCGEKTKKSKLLLNS